MVTLKRLAGLLAFSQVTEDADPPKDAKGRPCYLIANEITRAFAAVPSRPAAGNGWCCRRKGSMIAGIPHARKSVSVPRGACSSFRSIRQWIACPRSRSFTVGATRWAISPSQGWSDAGQQGIPHKILAPPQGAAHKTRVLRCPPCRATINKRAGATGPLVEWKGWSRDYGEAAVCCAVLHKLRWKRIGDMVKSASNLSMSNKDCATHETF